MSSPTPWSIKGIDAEARKVAKAAAQAEGMTLGAWMTQRIIAMGGDANATATTAGGPAKRRAPTSDGANEAIAAALSSVERRLEALSNRLDDVDQNVGRVSQSIDDNGVRVEIAERAAALIAQTIEKQQRVIEEKLAASSAAQSAGASYPEAVGAIVVDALSPVASHVETVVEEARSTRKATESAIETLSEQIDGAVGKHEEMSTAIGGAVASLAQRIEAVEAALESRSKQDDRAQADARDGEQDRADHQEHLLAPPLQTSTLGEALQESRALSATPLSAAALEPIDALDASTVATAVPIEETALRIEAGVSIETMNDGWDGDERREGPTVPNVDDPKAPARRQEDLMALRAKMRSEAHGPIEAEAKFGVGFGRAGAGSAKDHPPKPIEATPTPQRVVATAEGSTAFAIEAPPTEDALDDAFAEQETMFKGGDDASRPASAQDAATPSKDEPRDTGKELNRLADRLLKRTHLSESGDSFVYSELDDAEDPLRTASRSESGGRGQAAKVDGDEPSSGHKSTQAGATASTAKGRAAKDAPAEDFTWGPESDAPTLPDRSVAKTASDDSTGGDGKPTKRESKSAQSDPYEELDIWADLDEAPAAKRSRTTTLVAIGASALVMSFAIVYISRIVG